MKLRPTVLLAVALIVIAFVEKIQAQSPFYMPVTITQSGNTAVDTLGVADGATYCIDSTLGEKELNRCDRTVLAPAIRIPGGRRRF